jgi:hypothetical protein
MNRIKLFVIALIVFSSGCAQSLPTHEEVNRAFTRSFDATGLNYSSKSRITNLTVPKQEPSAATVDKRIQYIQQGIDLLRGLSVNADGAIDTKAKRSEVLYDLHYDRDNVEVSVKIPLLVDYGTQTIYVGSSFFNTILETMYPQAPKTSGKLIRININELLQENAESPLELSKIIGGNRFSSNNIELLNNAFKAGIVKAVARLKDTSFSDQALTEQDRSAGIARRIHINVSHSDSVALVLDLIEGVAQTLLRDGVISQKEYDTLLALTDKQTLSGITDAFILTTVFDVGIAPSGFVGRVESQFNMADSGGTYQVGINNVSTLSNYNAPRFSMNPEKSGIVDFKELLGAMTAEAADDQECSEDDDEPGEADITTGAPS